MKNYHPFAAAALVAVASTFAMVVVYLTYSDLTAVFVTAAIVTAIVAILKLRDTVYSGDAFPYGA